MIDERDAPGPYTEAEKVAIVRMVDDYHRSIPAPVGNAWTDRLTIYAGAESRYAEGVYTRTIYVETAKHAMPKAPRAEGTMVMDFSNGTPRLMRMERGRWTQLVAVVHGGEAVLRLPFTRKAPTPPPPPPEPVVHTPIQRTYRKRAVR